MCVVSLDVHGLEFRQRYGAERWDQVKLNDLAVVGSSPEIMVRVEGDRMTIRPLAGTRPRDDDVEALANWQIQVAQERIALTRAVPCRGS